MQEAELRERIEQFFASALAQTYQRDALIEFYHVLRQAWSQLEQAPEQGTYFSLLREVFQRVKSAGLSMQRESQLEAVDQEIIESIQHFCAQIAGEEKLS